MPVYIPSGDEPDRIGNPPGDRASDRTPDRTYRQNSPTRSSSLSHSLSTRFADKSSTVVKDNVEIEFWTEIVTGFVADRGGPRSRDGTPARG